MTELIPFHFNGQQVRVIDHNNEPWFVAADVADILGYRNAPDMTRNLDDDEADTHNLRSSSQSRQMIIISESGLYNAIFRSRRAEAKAFRRWVTSTVLPQIRRTGSFYSDEQQLLPQLAGLDHYLDGKTHVTLPEVAAAMGYDTDPLTLSYFAKTMRSRGWKKAWVRAREPKFLEYGRLTDHG